MMIEDLHIDKNKWYSFIEKKPEADHFIALELSNDEDKKNVFYALFIKDKGLMESDPQNPDNLIPIQSEPKYWRHRYSESRPVILNCEKCGFESSDNSFFEFDPWTCTLCYQKITGYSERELKIYKLAMVHAKDHKKFDQDFNVLLGNSKTLMDELYSKN